MTLAAHDQQPHPEQRDRLERVATNRIGLWWALALQLLGLLLFVLVFNFVLPSLGDELGQPGRIALGLVFSLVPAALWLVVFYGFDRAEPEPKHLVLRVFLGGAVLFAALSTPVLDRFFQIDAWLYATWWSRLLGGILIVGLIEQSIVYLAVRALAFEHPEFDERVDGVIYAVAAGLGVATVINFQYVLERGGVDLDIGSVRMVVNTLAYASFAGLLGYFIGQARFERVPWYYLPLGLLAAATLNGLLFYFLEGQSTGLSGGKPWGDLLLAAVVALFALLLVFLLVARANEETLRVARGAAPRRATPAPAPRGMSLPYTGRSFGTLPAAAAHGAPEEVEPPGAAEHPPDAWPPDERPPDAWPPATRRPEKGDPQGGAR